MPLPRLADVFRRTTRPCEDCSPLVYSEITGTMRLVAATANVIERSRLIGNTIEASSLPITR